MNNTLTPIRLRTLAAAMVLSTTSGISLAQDQQPAKPVNDSVAIGSGAVIGGIAGGPVGMIIGAAVGALVGENQNQTAELKHAEIDMHNAANNLAQLEQELETMDAELAFMRTETERLEQNLVTRLEFQMLFRTGDDRLSELDRERVSMLVDYLNRNPQFKVRLEGHADQRGTDEYNNVLSKYRARAVADALIARGITAKRIETLSHGSSRSRTTNGDYEGYALDRRVNIEVFHPDKATEVALVD